MPDGAQVLAYGPTAFLLFLVLAFILRIAPVWKEVKLRELDIRAAESGTQEKVATALAGLATVLQAIGVDQRRVSENLEIMHRVNADANDRLASIVGSLTIRLDKIEDVHYRQVMETTNDLIGRMDKLENADSTTTGAG